jgi:LPXTG-motif cell wall-anchored protein
MRARNVAIIGLVAGLGLPLLVTAPAVSAASSRPSFTTTLLSQSDGRSEPRVTVTPDGTRYVDTNAKDGTEVVYASRDGKSWSRVAGVPPLQTQPTTDVDIVATHTGRLIASELDFSGINFITAYSDDKGKTWTPSVGQTFADTDRQWFAVGPDDPTTHQPRVYLLFHNLLSGVLSHNMFVSTSTDGGATFGPPVPVATPPQQDWLDLQCADSGGPSNIFYDKKTNRVFVVFGTRSSPVGGCAAQPTEVNVVAANRVWVVAAPADSTELPTSWTPHLAVNDTGVGGAPSHIVGMQLAPAASDTAGNVYVAYPESIHDYPDYDGGAIKVVHARAGDLDHWSAPSTVVAAGGPGNVLPHIVAGAPGKVDVAYYRGLRVSGAITWRSMAAQSLDALGTTPHWSSVQLSAVPAEPNQTASELMGACMQGQQATLNGFACDRAADVYGIALDKCGSLVVTWPAQAQQPTDGTYVSQQTGGPTLGLCPAQSTARRTSASRVPSGGTTGSGALAATGTSALLPVAGLALLSAAAVVLRRRRKITAGIAG